MWYIDLRDLKDELHVWDIYILYISTYLTHLMKVFHD